MKDISDSSEAKYVVTDVVVLKDTNYRKNNKMKNGDFSENKDSEVFDTKKNTDMEKIM